MNDPSKIVEELIFGRWRSQILYAGVKLGVFDALGDASKTSSDIAEVLRLDPALTYRLLRALASLGLLHEDTNRSFALHRLWRIPAGGSSADNARRGPP